MGFAHVTDMATVGEGIRWHLLKFDYTKFLNDSRVDFHYYLLFI